MKSLKTKAGPVRVKPSPQDITFAADIDEAARDQRKTDKLLRNEKALMKLRELNKLKKHEKELEKLKQRKWGT